MHIFLFEVSLLEISSVLRSGFSQRISHWSDWGKLKKQSITFILPLTRSHRWASMSYAVASSSNRFRVSKWPCPIWNLRKQRSSDSSWLGPLSLNPYPSVNTEAMSYWRLRAMRGLWEVAVVQNDNSVPQKCMGYKGLSWLRVNRLTVVIYSILPSYVTSTTICWYVHATGKTSMPRYHAHASIFHESTISIP